tara:strand:+ start:275 stop:490 length:216 start_codon:yes stop_codon:yes gene_type:complete
LEVEVVQLVQIMEFQGDLEVVVMDLEILDKPQLIKVFLQQVRKLLLQVEQVQKDLEVVELVKSVVLVQVQV